MDGIFWIKWILATTLGINVGGFFGIQLVEALTNLGGKSPNLFLTFVSTILGGSLFGSLLGVAQWTLLRKRIDKASRWIWATILSGIIFGCAIYLIVFGFVGLALICLIMGTTLGIYQGRVLGRSRLWCWLVVSLVGIAGFALIGFVGGYGFANLIMSFGIRGFGIYGLIAAAITGAATYGTITGIGLIKILEE
jgi:hypothetical protein